MPSFLLHLGHRPSKSTITHAWHFLHQYSQGLFFIFLVLYISLWYYNLVYIFPQKILYTQNITNVKRNLLDD